MKKIALVVGIDTYSKSPLDCCVNDAKSIAAILKSDNYKFDSVIEVYNSDATRKNIKYELAECAASPNDLMLFYFSGHGIKTSFGTYICTVDADDYEEGIDFDYIKRCIVCNEAKNKSSVVVLDCCHAGSGGLLSGMIPKTYITDANIKDSLDVLGSGRVVLAACEEAQKSFEDSSEKHGVYTLHLLAGLQGEAADRDGDITAPGLHTYVCSKLRANAEQIPVFNGDIAGKFILGQGFPPRNEISLTESEYSDFESTAKKLLDEYQGKMSAYSDRNNWKNAGYKAACQLLEPISNWFRSKIIAYPSLLNRKEFISLNEDLLSRKSILASIDIGTKLVCGKVSEVLGTGTFGTVYKVHDESLNVNYAYKVYHSQDIRIADKIKRFERGYQAMKQLDHPHIVKVHSYSECPVGFFMDYVNGPNLRAISCDMLDLTEKLMQMLIISDTLAHAHRRYIYHRDVKPENIILKYSETDGYWQPFLTDFDLAWFSAATKVTKDGMGTLYYASPEQLSKPNSRLAKMPTTDIYAFGQLCFYLLTWRDPVPFNQVENIEILSKVVATEMRHSPAEAFMNFYRKATAFDPNDRHTDFSSISESLFRVKNLIADVSIDKELTFDTFIEELIYSIVGLTPGKKISRSTFDTLAGRFTISLSQGGTSRTSVTAYIEAKDRALMTGCSHAEVCKIYNKRVEGVLTSLRYASFTQGHSSPYSINATFLLGELSYMTVEKLRSVIVSLIEALERN